MQTSFLERHAEDILGVYSCFDRIIIQGTLPDIAHADAMTQWFFTHKLRIFDFPEWAKPYRERIRSHAEAVANKAGIQIEFIRKIDSFRKEDRIAEILSKRGEHPDLVPFTQVENAFVNISDFAKAQFLADACDPAFLYRHMEQAARRYCDVIGVFPSGVHWSIMQLERATNIVFKSHDVLAPIYEEIVRTLSHAVRPDTLTMFLGKPLDPRYEGELGSKFSTRIEGHCLRHLMGSTGLKIYDKFGRVLRIETFTNDVTFFKHYRKVEHRDGTACFKMASVRKSIFSLPPLAELMDACNRRYLEFLAAVDDPTNALDTIQKVSRPVRQEGRSYRGFNLLFRKYHLTALGK